MLMMMHTPSSAVVIYHTGYERKTKACVRNVQRIRQSDINADLLPSYLNVRKPLSLLLSHPVSLSTLLSLSLSLSIFFSHTTNTAHNLLLLFKSCGMSHRQGCATYTQVYSLGFIIHLPIRQPSEMMTPQTPI